MVSVPPQSHGTASSPPSSVVSGLAGTIEEDQSEEGDETVRAGSEKNETEPWPDSGSVVKPGGGPGVEYEGQVLDLTAVSRRDIAHATTMWLFDGDEVKAFCYVVKSAWRQNANAGIGMNSKYTALMSVVRIALQGQKPHSMVLHEFVAISASKEPPSTMSYTDWQDLWCDCITINPDKGKT
jgi:hypothetical protein